MKIGELFVELGFKADTIKLNEVAQLIGRLNLSSVLASFGVKELYDGLRDIMEIGEKTAMGMNLFGKETGLSAQQMTQWTRYAEEMGVSGDAVSAALTTLQKKATGLKSGLDSSLLTPLYMLNQAGAGITNADLDNPFTFLEKAIKGLQNVNPALKTTIAGMLGINEQLLALKSFKDANTINVLSENDVKSLMEYHKSVVELGNTWKNIWEEMAASMAPTLDGLAMFAEQITNAIKGSEKLAQDLKYFMIGVAAAIAFATGPIGALTFLVVSLLALVGQLEHYGPEIKSALSGLSLNGLKNAGSNVVGGIESGVQGIAKSITTSISNTFHITGNNPHEIAKVVDEHLSKHLSDAQYQQPLTSR